ncbi:MAG: CBS domain-containing protein [Bacillota bacterium]|nr:CBS domain-containing protein [Bacillota bacterium]
MHSVSTFYLSRILGNKIYSKDNKPIGTLTDLIVDMNNIRPKVIAIKAKIDHKDVTLDFSSIQIAKQKGQYILFCLSQKESALSHDGCMFLTKHVLDRQIVDMDGTKVVRVNDIRLAILSSGAYVVAVDVGIEGLLRRLGVAKPLKKPLKLFGLSIPSKLILWDEVATVDFSHSGIRLTKEQTKLSTLHPSDLADIIEDLDKNTQLAIIKSLDEEQAADVIEELEPDVRRSVIGSLSVEKAADVLEKMPADEVADILDEMDEDKAEELLNEMESEASEEVRELMEYPDDTVGSLMSTEYISFNENQTIDETIKELRKLKPESDSIYYLYVLDDSDRLIATVSLRDVIISEPETKLNQIMNRKVISINDNDEIDSLAEIISKYSLLAIPVVDDNSVMLGMVVIDDVVTRLLKARRRKV